jgi:hypothetical protein
MQGWRVVWVYDFRIQGLRLKVHDLGLITKDQGLRILVYGLWHRVYG